MDKIAFLIPMPDLDRQEQEMEMIDTPLLLLRRLSVDDVDAMAPMYADPEVMEYSDGMLTREETADRLRLIISLFDAQGYGLLGIVERESGRLIGRAGLLVQVVDGVRELELVYALVRASWGKGYATEAVAAVRHWAFHHLPDAHFISLVPVTNVRSVRVAERLGARHDRDINFHGRRVRVYVHDRPSEGP